MLEGPCHGVLAMAGKEEWQAEQLPLSLFRSSQDPEIDSLGPCNVWECSEIYKAGYTTIQVGQRQGT